MALVTFTVNGKTRSVDGDPDTPLLWVLRDSLGLTGTKYGCGIGLCGSCTVHVGGVAVRSCSVTLSQVSGEKIVTIEGLSPSGHHPLQKAWLQAEVAQCGYCQPGQIMTAATLLAVNPDPTDEEIDAAMTGNLCRCGTYRRIRKAIHQVAQRGGVQ